MNTIFLREINDAEIPVISPIPFQDGATIHQMESSGIYYTIFPKVGWRRAPDELNIDQRRQLGRLIARIHNVGAAKESKHRMELSPETYGLSNLDYLLRQKWIPIELEKRYVSSVEKICDIAKVAFADIEKIRLHGDCHMNNILWDREQAFFLDFDDMVRGPAVQDLWLLVTEEGAAGQGQMDEMLEGYQEMREFDRSSLRIVEMLRALRFIHYTAWLARRWEDPIFPASFPMFNTFQYWEEKTRDLEAQLVRCQAHLPT